MTAACRPTPLQHPFHDHQGRLIAVGDLWWEDRRLLVEADGRGPHELPRALLHDRRRQNALELARPDLRLLRFTWEDLRNPSYILDAIRQVPVRSPGSPRDRRKVATTSSSVVDGSGITAPRRL